MKVVNIYKKSSDAEANAANPKGRLYKKGRLVTQKYIDLHLTTGLMSCEIDEEATEKYYKDAAAHKEELKLKEEAQKQGVNGLAEALIKGIKGDSKDDKPKATRGRKPKQQEETKTEE